MQPITKKSPTAAVGKSYSFTPTASDPEGQPLSFSITNKPAWASFAASTGRLYGTPGSTRVGTYSNIVITASDGETSASLGPFSIEVDQVDLGGGVLFSQHHLHVARGIDAHEFFRQYQVYQVAEKVFQVPVVALRIPREDVSSQVGRGSLSVPVDGDGRIPGVFPAGDDPAW